MPIEQSKRWETGVVVPIGVVITAIISLFIWFNAQIDGISKRTIRTEGIQEAVLTRLGHHDAEIDAMHERFDRFPAILDERTKDRWFRSEEMLDRG